MAGPLLMGLFAFLDHREESVLNQLFHNQLKVPSSTFKFEDVPFFPRKSCFWSLIIDTNDLTMVHFFCRVALLIFWSSLSLTSCSQTVPAEDEFKDGQLEFGPIYLPLQDQDRDRDQYSAMTVSGHWSLSFGSRKSNVIIQPAPKVPFPNVQQPLL